MSKLKSSRRLPLIVNQYREFSKFATAFANGHLNLLIVTGDPGLGKSHLLKRVLGSNMCLIEGRTTAFDMYRRLYEHRGQPVLIDDVDEIYRDRDAIRLLKSLCQTDATKTVSWNSAANQLEKDDIPRQFDTISKVAIVANDWQSATADIAALEDRGHLIHFAPTALDVHVMVAEWFWDQEVFDFLADHLSLIERPSFRHYLAAAELKRGGLAWREGTLGRLINGKLLVVAQLKANGAFASEQDRVEAFVSEGHGCRATYFNLAKKLPPKVDAPRLILTASPPLEPSQPPVSILDILRKRHGDLGNG